MVPEKKQITNVLFIACHKYDDENIFKMYCLIIGTENTPYEDGFYLFDFTFTEEYPLKPPKVKYCTLNGNIRFNPNLYTCGKVCLSILNTYLFHTNNHLEDT